MSIKVGLEYVGHIDPWTDEERLSDEEIVRCRDCKHCMSYWKSDYCDYFAHVTNDPDGFCAWGCRKCGGTTTRGGTHEQLR